MRLALLDDYQGVALGMADWASEPALAVTAFGEFIDDPENLVAMLAPFQAVMMMRERTPFPAALLERLPELRLIVTAGMANAALDLEAATRLGIQVCGTRTWPHATPELALGLVLAVARRIPQEAAGMKAGHWQQSVGMGLYGRTLGLIGLGNIGRRMAAFGRVLGMEVIAWSANLDAATAAEHGARRVERDELLATADVVSIHVRLSERTRALIGAREFALMKPGAILINTSRGPIVEEAALLDALRGRQIAGAGLDVYDVEPLPADHPLLGLDNAVLLPHLGYVGTENYRVIYGDVLEAAAGFLAGRPVRPLNAPVGV